MILFVGGDPGIFLLSQEPAAGPIPETIPETIEEDLFGWEPIPWPQRKKIVAASFTIQEQQTEHLEAKVKTAIQASAIGVSKCHAEKISTFEKTKIFINGRTLWRSHEERISAREKTKIYARAIEISTANMLILSIQDTLLIGIAERERKNRDMRDLLEIITMGIA